MFSRVSVPFYLVNEILIFVFIVIATFVSKTLQLQVLLAYV